MTQKIRIGLSAALIALLAACGGANQVNDGFTMPASSEAKGGGTTGGGSTITGQAIMVNLSGGGTYALVQTQQYRFNSETGATYFGTTVSQPSVDCNGQGCATCIPPGVPEAPAPDSYRVTNPGGSGVADKSRCTFLDGGVLSLTDTYTKTLSVSGSCSYDVYNDKSGKTSTVTDRYNYTFGWTYTVAALSTEPVAAGTAWDLDRVVGGDAVHVDITADIAGESAMSSKQNPIKYSFSMLDSYGVSRVQNLATYLDGVLVGNPGATVNSPVDFTFTQNAGTNGTTTLLVNGYARGILNGQVCGSAGCDHFAGNDNGGTDGSALALATTGAVGLDLAPGPHAVSLTGTVKDNTASTGDIAFNVNEVITVVTPGCGQLQP